MILGEGVVGNLTKALKSPTKLKCLSLEKRLKPFLKKRILLGSSLTAAIPAGVLTITVISHELKHCVIGNYCGYPEKVLSFKDFIELGAIGPYAFSIVFLFFLLVFGLFGFVLNQFLEK
jgi:hypothetical protein